MSYQISYPITGLVGSVHRTSFPRRDSSARIVESTARLTCLDLSGFLGAVWKIKLLSQGKPAAEVKRIKNVLMVNSGFLIFNSLSRFCQKKTPIKALLT